MSDQNTNEDRLDLEKCEREILHYLKLLHAPKKPFLMFKKIIEEVNRLRLDESNAQHYSREAEQWEDEANRVELLRQEQITSLTKERDEWKERYMKSTRKDFVEKMEKLEAEKAELIGTIKQRDGLIGSQYIKITDLKQKLAAAEKKVEELEADLPAICDEPDCGAVVACGTPTKSGYRNTCSFHIPDKSEWK